MLRLQNPDELVEDEVLEGEILAPPQIDPDHFPAETDIEIFVSDGHVNWAQMSNFLRAGMFFIPACLLASTALIGYSLSDFTSVTDVARSVFRMEPTENLTGFREPSDGRSLLGRGAYSLIGWDPETAISLPDGQRVHARLAFLSQLPDSRIGQLDADGYRQLIGDYQAALVKASSTDEDQRIRDEADASAMEASSEWNTTAWKLRYRLATSTLTIQKPTTFETVSAQGFWGEEANLERMATTGTIATTENPGTFFAAAYIGGVPAVTMLNDYSCYTIMGVAFDGCSPLSMIDDQALQLVRDTLYGAPAKAVVAADVPAPKEVEVPKPWYLDFPLVAGLSTLTQANFDALTKAVDLNAQGQGGSNLHTTITSPVSLLPSAPMTAQAKGLLHNPQAIEAMKMGGVVATTDVPGQFVMAAYVGGKAQVRVRTGGGICGVIFGETGSGCKEGDVSTVEAIPSIVKSLYEQPDNPEAPLEPYFWFSAAPMIAETSMDGNDIIRSFNAALQDVAQFGDDYKKWTKATKLQTPPHVTRPEGFFSKPDEVAMLRRKAVVILPRNVRNTFLLAANYEGHLNLEVIEIQPSGRWNCTAVFGPPSQMIRECGANDLTKNSDIIRSMFAAQ